MVVEAELAGIVEREVESLGFELVKIETAARGRRRLLRLYIDRPEGAVTIDDCVKVTRAVGFVLDGEERFPGPYILEVSSPGIDRPLTRPSHFERFVGHAAKVRIDGEDGKARTVTGEIAGVGDDGVRLSVGEETETVPWDRIRSASLRGEIPVPGKEPGGKGKGPSRKRL